MACFARITGWGQDRPLAFTIFVLLIGKPPIRLFPGFPPQFTLAKPEAGMTPLDI
jgi:hypothetical protein